MHSRLIGRALMLFTTALPSADVALNDASILADVTLDPWVFGVGLGYGFGR